MTGQHVVETLYGGKKKPHQIETSEIIISLRTVSIDWFWKASQKLLIAHFEGKIQEFHVPSMTRFARTSPIIAEAWSVLARHNLLPGTIEIDFRSVSNNRRLMLDWLKVFEPAKKEAADVKIQHPDGDFWRFRHGLRNIGTKMLSKFAKGHA